MNRERSSAPGRAAAATPGARLDAVEGELSRHGRAAPADPRAQARLLELLRRRDRLAARAARAGTPEPPPAEE